jgi:hypothetical protein
LTVAGACAPAAGRKLMGSINGAPDLAVEAG